MKLKQLFLASLAACTLASCSKDDNGISGPQEVDAYLSFAATTDLMTKASVDKGTNSGEGLEDKIQSLTAYVFDNDKAGKYVAYKRVSLNEGEGVAGKGVEGEDYDVTVTTNGVKSITSIKGIHVKVEKPAVDGADSDTEFQVILLANVKELNPADSAALKNSATDKDITNFNAETAEETIGKFHLPMHSAVLTVEDLKPVEEKDDGTKIHYMNWYGLADPEVATTGDKPHSATIPEGAEKVVMTRAISRVQLTSLKSNFTAQFENAKFEIDSIYLANVRGDATVMGNECTSAGYFRGGPVEFDEKKYLIAKESFDKKFLKEYLPNKLVLKNVSKGSKEYVASELGFDKYIYANHPTSASEKYQTRIIITGMLKNGNIPDDEGVRRYFHIPLRLVDNAGNVASNKFFNVKATITGEGSPYPDEVLVNACINFTIDVLPWNVVEQTEEDTN